MNIKIDIMKRQDLMLDNIVYAGNDYRNYMRIVNLGEDYAYLDLYQEEGLDVFEAVYEDMTPVPLTSDILNINGFVYNSFKKTYTLRDLNIESREGSFYISIGGKEKNLRYLHELQNIFRLLGEESLKIRK